MNISLVQRWRESWNESWNGFIANCCACITCLVNNKCLALNYLKLTFQVWVHLFSKSTSLILALQHNNLELVWKKKDFTIFEILPKMSHLYPPFFRTCKFPCPKICQKICLASLAILWNETFWWTDANFRFLDHLVSF